MNKNEETPTFKQSLIEPNVQENETPLIYYWKVTTSTSALKESNGCGFGQLCLVVFLLAQNLFPNVP